MSISVLLLLLWHLIKKVLFATMIVKELCQFSRHGYKRMFLIINLCGLFYFLMKGFKFFKGDTFSRHLVDETGSFWHFRPKKFMKIRAVIPKRLFLVTPLL